MHLASESVFSMPQVWQPMWPSLVNLVIFGVASSPQVLKGNLKPALWIDDCLIATTCKLIYLK